MSHTLAAVALAAGAGGCGVSDLEDELQPTAEAASPHVLSSATFTENSAVPNEHCRVHSTLASTWQAGRQLLIYRGSELRGMCTIQNSPSSASATTVEVNHETLKRRVWIEDDRPETGSPVPTSISGVTVRDETTLATAPAVVGLTSTVSDLVINDETPREYLSAIPTLNPSTQPREVTVAYTSPHPWENPGPSGDVGKAFAQWSAVESAKDTSHDAYWAVGLAGNVGDFKPDPETGNNFGNTARFHITSTQLNTASFPGLGSLINADIDYAVSFHGTAKESTSSVTQTCDQGLLVGGRLGHNVTPDTLAFRRGIAENIRHLVDPSDPTPPSPAGSGDHLGLLANEVRYSSGGACTFDQGIGTTNFVNVVANNTSGATTIQRGVQIESGGRLDKVIYQRVGGAIREVFDCLNVAPDATVSTAHTFAAQLSSGTAYTGGRCRGFVLDATLSDHSDVFTAELQTCNASGKVHTDVYRWNATFGGWDRVAGGTRTYTSCSPSVAFTDAAYDDDTSDTIVPSFQHTLSGATDGPYRIVVYGYTGNFFTTANALAVQVAASG